jgi:polyisoprenoid-binding protein YceI
MNKETKWSIDQSHSSIEFKVRHLMIANVKGNFKVFDGSIYTSEKDFTTVEIDMWIDVASISTGDEKRDEHLKGADFFDVVNHKQITFLGSTMISPKGNDEYELWGEMTIKGITQNLKLDAVFGGIITDSMGNEKAGFALTGKINRADFGLVWNATMETGGFMVSDEVHLTCEIELTNLTKQSDNMVLDSVAQLEVI